MTLLYRLLALAIGLCALIGLVLYAGHERAKVRTVQEALETANASLKRTEATSTLREHARASTARQAASARVSLTHTLAAPAVQPWADTPVPKEVQDDLCATVQCASAPGAGSMREPADGAASAP